MQTPILFLIFNRPSTTQLVFNEIRNARPERLYIAADGPRNDKVGELDLCNQTRTIVSTIDWPCEVKTLFRENNLGCKVAVSSAITWFFEHEEMGIILEDDCLPHPSFFPFCESLLEKYKHDETIGIISGNNFQNGIVRENASYYFSIYNHIWGWASWRRAWNNYDITMKEYPTFKQKKGLESIFKRAVEWDFWYENFDKSFANKINSWDFQWAFANMFHHKKHIIPNVNLVTNIGFGMDSTHTSSDNSELSNIAIEVIHFPLIHPISSVINTQADELVFDRFYKKDIYMVRLFHAFIQKIKQKMYR